MEKSDESQENTTSTMINKKRNNDATTSSSLPTNPNTKDDEEPKSKIQRECYIMKSPNFNLKITFAKPPSPQQQPLNNSNKQPGEASKTPVHVISSNNNKPKVKKIKKPAIKLSFVDHNNDATKASIIEHVTRNLGYNKEDISEVKVIMEKRMTPSDMAPQQARLSLPAGSEKKLDASFLTNQEKELLKQADIEVKVIMGSFVYKMPLSRWNYFDKNKKKNNNDDDNNNNNNEDDPGFKYVLKSGKGRVWPRLKKENGLQEDDYILVATCRHNNALHFVIIKGRPVMVFGTAIGHNYSFKD